jgi:hypothetical protein
MKDIERQFDYNAGAGMLRLLGVLCFILAPVAMWMTFQEGKSGSLWLYGSGWFAYIPPALAPWAVRVISVVLLWVGYMLFKGAGEQEKFGGRIAFTPTGLIFEAGPPDGLDNETKYQDIADVRVADRKGEKTLFFTRGGNIKCFVKMSQMKSPAEFDEMAALLAARVPATSAVPAGG